MTVVILKASTSVSTAMSFLVQVSHQLFSGDVMRFLKAGVRSLWHTSSLSPLRRGRGFRGLGVLNPNPKP